MACYHPLKVWYSKEVNPTGKRNVVFNATQALDPSDPFNIPCSQCVGCRLERSRQWATRCIHEASLYQENCFITLTFSPEALASRKNPESLDVEEYQKFMKRLRKKFIPLNPYHKKKEKELYDLHHEKYQIRFFHAGEYGDNLRRPHYHALLFNFDFEDKTLWKMENGQRLYISKSLQELWPHGFSSIGTVTFESAAYVARYIMKKHTGENAETAYNLLNHETGELNQIKPEYTTMSRRPGIGKKWFEKYRNDVYPKDFITVNGKKIQPPKYYDKLLEQDNEFDFDQIKEERLMKMMNSIIDNPYESSAPRLAVKEKHKLLQMERLPRTIHKD